MNQAQVRCGDLPPTWDHTAGVLNEGRCKSMQRIIEIQDDELVQGAVIGSTLVCYQETKYTLCMGLGGR